MPGSRRNSGRDINVGTLIQQQTDNNDQQQQQQHQRHMNHRAQEVLYNDHNLTTRTSSLRTRHGSIMDLETSATTGSGGGVSYQNSSPAMGSSNANSLGIDPNSLRNGQRRASSSTLIQYNNYVT